MSLKAIQSSQSIKTQLNIPSSKSIKLMCEIQKCRDKIMEYQQIEKQVASLGKELLLDQKPQKHDIATMRTSHRVPDRQAASTKMRLYQLERKLAKAKLEFRQKHETRCFRKRELSELLQQSITLEQDIFSETQVEDQLRSSLQNLMEHAAKAKRELQTQNLKLSESKKAQQLYQFELTKLRDEVNLAKKAAKPYEDACDDILENFSISEMSRKYSESLKLELSSSFSGIEVNKDTLSSHRKRFSEFVGQADTIESLKGNKISLNNQQSFQDKIKTDSNDTHFTFDELNKMQAAKGQLKVQKENLETNIDSLLLKLRHKQTNRVLLETSLSKKEKQLMRITEKTQCIEQASSEATKQIRELEGKRGALRGKLGIVTEQAFLVKAVNRKLRDDFQILEEAQKELCDYMRLSEQSFRVKLEGVR